MQLNCRTCAFVDRWRLLVVVTHLVYDCIAFDVHECAVQELTSVSQQLRANIPSAAAHFEALEEALDPVNEIEEQYYPTTSVVSIIDTPNACCGGVL
jgi:hypothetical protein